MATPEQGLPPESKTGDAESKGLFARIKESAIDNYNGLYVIVLKPRMPETILYWMAIIGVLLGIIWAYVVAPVVWTGGNPNRLNDASQQQWLTMLAVSNSDTTVYGPEQLADLASRVPNPRAQIDAMIVNPDISSSDAAALRELLTVLPQDIDAASAPAVTAGSGILSFIWAWVVPIIVMIVLVVLVTLIWRFFIYDNFWAPMMQRIKEARDPEERARAEASRREIATMKQQAELRDKLKKESASSALGPPAMTQLAIYTPGRNFDESYEIELESGEFLGQSGTVIAEAVDPDPVAIEVWLFDMASSKNLTKMFVTPQGNADPAIRSKLEMDVDNPATDIIVAEIGKPLVIDTDKLHLEAKFANLDIDASGRFQNFNLQMQAWDKDGSSGATPPPPSMPSTPSVPTGAPDMSVYDDIQFDPPPPMPSGGSTPPSMPSTSSSPTGAPDMSIYDDIQFDPPPPMPSGGSANPPPMTPLSPPPLMPNDNDDDDPFGGTGDFTPIPPNA